MFESLRIRNFKSWDDVTIHFDKGVNVIQGLSFTGKTNILRSLRLLFENRPQGGKFFSDFAGDKGKTVIDLKLIEGKTISLQKDIHINKKGEKLLDKSTYRMEEFESTAPQLGIPDQINQVLNISELNMQRQFDRPFLIMSSPGEVARVINKITKLEEVDEWVSNVTSQINQNQKEVNKLVSEIDSEEITLKKYGDIEETETIVKALIQTEKEISFLLYSKDVLDKRLVQLEDNQRSLEKILDFLTAERYINKVEALIKEVAIQAVFQALINDWELYTTLIEKRGNDVLEHEILVNKLEASDYSELSSLHNKLKGLLDRYDLLVLAGENSTAAIDNAKRAYMDKVLGMKKCPLLGIDCEAVKNAEIIGQIEREL